MKMKGATPLKQNQGTNVRQQKNILATPKNMSHGKHRLAQKNIKSICVFAT